MLLWLLYSSWHWVESTAAADLLDANVRSWVGHAMLIRSSVSSVTVNVGCVLWKEVV